MLTTRHSLSANVGINFADKLCLLGVSAEEFLDELGQELIVTTCEKRLKERAFRCLGGNLQEFLTTLDGVHDVLQGEGAPERASFVCTADPAGHLDLLFATERPAVALLLLGSLKAIANRFYHTDASISVSSDDDPGHYRMFLEAKREQSNILLLVNPVIFQRCSGLCRAEHSSKESYRLHKICYETEEEARALQRAEEPLIIEEIGLYRITPAAPSGVRDVTSTSLSRSAADLRMGVASFCKAFPWHFVMDRHLEMVQLGAGFMQLFARDLRTLGTSVATYFEFRRPRGIALCFNEIVKRANTPFVLSIRWPDSTAEERLAEGLELKGQMVFCPESDSILFVGSPFLDGLDGLTGRGLFISDIPLHDATRDVILVGEQARAQVEALRRADHPPKEFYRMCKI
ncbi:hypothetical protein B7P43_G13046 [Cryptotermes secundus]|uniref:guanylate cyclase n=1 Tax=Cryptotermes secundus TaxID=105785 RepID=A0A2J7R4J7_9NEOP|nr:hypothetical protein B7P43_G13046 [Cryptotermes secundus]